MNKIFKKCREFGLMVRLNDLKVEKALECVQSLKRGNIPLCIVDTKKEHWKDLLKEIAFKEDLFIAAENICSITDAYTAAGNGAQFFILENSDPSFMKELKESGFYFIPRILSLDDILKCQEMDLECIISDDNNLLINTSLYNIQECTNIINIGHHEKTIFSIIDLPKNCKDFELWINSIVKNYLGLNYTEVVINMNSSSDTINFGEIFASTNKCKTISGDENCIFLDCKDFTRAVNYLKWKKIYINPNNVEINNGDIIRAYLDRTLSDYSIILRETR